MILDDFKLVNTIFQIQYDHAYELWDRAGAIARHLVKIWPDLKVSESQPQSQIFTSDDVTVQTGLTKSTITMPGEKTFDQLRVRQVKETFDVWCKELELSDLVRVSTRVTYAHEYETLGEANRRIFALNLARWPDAKVFDQPQQSEHNGLEMLYRFEDENSFSVLRVKAEQLTFEANLDAQYVENPKIKVSKKQAIIDFDRGMLGTVSAGKLRIEDWFKGYQHILRRDIGKIIAE